MRGQSLYDYCMEHEDKKYLLEEWDYEKNESELGISPKDVARANSRIKVWWKCNNGHTYDASVSHRTDRNSGCPYCSNKKALKGYNDLATTHFELSKEWHPTKNGDLTPLNVTYGSNKKVWWLCEKGHEYEAIVANRTRMNSGCPVCDNKQVIKGYNDFGSKYPELAKEWHPIKNGTLTPYEITSGSHRKVWWKCSFGHEWESILKSRTLGHQGCPYCAKEMQSSFPEQTIYYYLTQIFDKVKNGVKGLIGNFELDVYISEIKTAIEYDGVKWHKDIDKDLKKNKLCRERGIRLIRIREEGLFDVEGSINIFRKNNDSDSDLENVLKELFSLLGIEVDVNIERDRQDIYSQYVQSKKENSLAVKFPEIAKEWHPIKNGKLTPEHVSYASNKKVWWMCSKGHEWEREIKKRINCGCPVCAGRIVLEGYNDLASMCQELLKDYDYEKNNIQPSEVYWRGHKKVWWKCSVCGHSWETIVYSRAILHSGCPECMKKKWGITRSRNSALNGNDLFTLYPDIASEWHPVKNGELTSQNISKGSRKKVWWLCKKCGNEWEAVVATRTGSNTGCPECAKKNRKS